MNLRLLSVIAILYQFCPAHAGDAITIASNIGVQAGKGIYCGYGLDAAEMVKLSARAIDELSTSNQQGSDAVKQFLVAFHLAQKMGPQGESCSEFKESFDESLSMLRSRYQ
jgi:hypothetical protein